MGEGLHAHQPGPDPARGGRPISGEVVAQLVRFGLTGALVFGVYTGGTLLLSGPMGIPVVLSIGIAYVVGVALNFTLQRRFVFPGRERFALRLRTQALRYVAAGACMYGLTSLAVTTLPSVIGASQRIVFLIVVLPISLLSFGLLRTAIFHAPRSARPVGRSTGS